MNTLRFLLQCVDAVYQWLASDVWTAYQIARAPVGSMSWKNHTDEHDSAGRRRWCSC